MNSADHRHRWKFREIREPGLRRTRIEYRCATCNVLAVVGPTGGLSAPEEPEPSG